MPRANLPAIWGLQPLNAKESDLVTFPVASAYGTAIYPGEPVLLVSDGTVARTPAGSAAGVATDGIFGVVTRIEQYYDAAVGDVRKTGVKYLPASTTYTGDKNRSLVQVCLANSNQRFRARANAASTVATMRSAVGNNIDHAYGTANTTLGRSGLVLGISTINTTNTLQWRIVEFPDGPLNDATATDFWFDVIPNLIQGLPTLGGSLTGV
jgi:hypothetical protein